MITIGRTEKETLDTVAYAFGGYMHGYLADPEDAANPGCIWGAHSWLFYGNPMQGDWGSAHVDLVDANNAVVRNSGKKRLLPGPYWRAIDKKFGLTIIED